MNSFWAAIMASIIHPHGIHGGDHGTHAGPADHVNRYARLIESPYDADVGKTARTSTSQHQADGIPGQYSRQALHVSVIVPANVMMTLNLPFLQPLAGSGRESAAVRMDEDQDAVKSVDPAVRSKEGLLPILPALDRHLP